MAVSAPDEQVQECGDNAGHYIGYCFGIIPVYKNRNSYGTGQYNNYYGVCMAQAIDVLGKYFIHAFSVFSLSQTVETPSVP
jgi:hypothetical protein